jgi:hypothetical protein
VDWSVVEKQIHHLMDHHGEFVPGDPEWNAQARLEEEVANFIKEEFRVERATSTIRKRVATALERWRAKRVAGN